MKLALETSVNGIRSLIAEWRNSGSTTVLVPTMGALHAGHMAIVENARQLAERVVVSIFVNPTQFGSEEDFPSYPRDLDGDLNMLSQHADAVFAPKVDEMYPQGYATTVNLAGPAEGLETDFRPGFFSGVATVVTKLLVAVAPDIAIFGDKDYQQLLVVRRLVSDLRLPVEILSHPIERDSDGLALSSRNSYLTVEQRKTAPQLYRSLVAAALAIRAGELAATALEEARAALNSAGLDLDYVELRDANTLDPVIDQTTSKMRILAAARLGRTRLIDNVPV
ncbi:MAG: pantoate--beta-alanine ligase [Alphaproteobacteria bacterium]